MSAVAKAGTLVLVSSGEYSDYSVISIVRVLSDFTPAEELEQYLSAHPEQREDYSFEKDQYFAHLLKRGLVEELEHSTYHLGDYSEHDRVEFFP